MGGGGDETGGGGGGETGEVADKESQSGVFFWGEEVVEGAGQGYRGG